jgi:hypothetical protein
MVDAGVCEPLGSAQLQSVIEAAYSLIRLGEVKSAEHLLKPFTSELAEVRPTVDQGLAMTWSSSGQTNGGGAL